MDKILISHIGDDWSPYIAGIFKNNYNIINFIDNDIKEKLINPDNFYRTSYYDEEHNTQLISELIPLNNIIISSALELSDMDIKSNNEKIKIILSKIFLFIKALYTPLMQQRKGKVWIFEPKVNLLINDSTYIFPLIYALKKGVKALTIVLALELSRKNIMINHVEGDFINKLDRFEKIVKWSLKRDNIYLTAQELII